MKVAHLAPGRKFDVWVLCADDDTCPVLDVLAQARAEHPDLTDTIMALRLEEVPNEGPPLDDPRRAKVLFRDILYEVKADQDITRKLHVGLRVAFFYDCFDKPVIVYAHAFRKSGSSTPEADLDTALEKRSTYFEHKHENKLEFMTETLI
jgi:phage-related protein